MFLTWLFHAAMAKSVQRSLCCRHGPAKTAIAPWFPPPPRATLSRCSPHRFRLERSTASDANGRRARRRGRAGLGCTGRPSASTKHPPPRPPRQRHRTARLTRTLTRPPKKSSAIARSGCRTSTSVRQAAKLTICSTSSSTTSPTRCTWSVTSSTAGNCAKAGTGRRRTTMWYRKCCAARAKARVWSSSRATTMRWRASSTA